ncbi:MAG: hypothetical protein STHCBS139747_006887 [Sporothrix thermara]
MEGLEQDSVSTPGLVSDYDLETSFDDSTDIDIDIDIDIDTDSGSTLATAPLLDNFLVRSDSDIEVDYNDDGDKDSSGVLLASYSPPKTPLPASASASASAKRSAHHLELYLSDGSEDDEDALPVTRHVRRRPRLSKCRRTVVEGAEENKGVDEVKKVKEVEEEDDDDDDDEEEDDMPVAFNRRRPFRSRRVDNDSDSRPQAPASPPALKRTASSSSNTTTTTTSSSRLTSNASSTIATPLDTLDSSPPSSPLLPPSPSASSSSDTSFTSTSSAPDIYDIFEFEQQRILAQDTDKTACFPRRLGECLFFSEEKDKVAADVPLMTLAKRSVIVSPAAASRASSTERHPHDLDKTVADGDHLLVHMRPRNPKTGQYVARRKPMMVLDTPRGELSRTVCPYAQPLDRAGEAQLLLAAGKRSSTRAAAAQALGGSGAARADREAFRSTQLTLEQNASKTYLSYHAVTLTYEDVRVLRNGWLTDNNITFWEEYLEREVLPKYPQARIALLRASLTLILMAADNIDSARKALPDFRTTTHIFLPISDAKDLSRSESGSHWSLLLVSVIDGVAFHYDSMHTSNLREARNVAARMAMLLGRPLRFRHIDDTPQQDNGNDCGVFVCVLMRFLLVKRLLNAHAREKVSMSLGGKMIDAQGGRKEMLRIIENLRREGERRRSTSPFVKKDVPRIE